MLYSTVLFDESPDWKSVPTAGINSFHWERDRPFRPESTAQLCGVRGQGLFARLWSFEDNPRCIYTKRDEPVYQDSCLELFLQPVPGNPAYVNFEINCRGVYLSQFGTNRSGRVFLKDFCTLEPRVSCFELVDHGKTAWGVEIFISEKLIGEIFNVDFALSPGEMKGNFYKCGDKTPVPHYAAFFPAGSAALGFHNPACFGRIILN